jgi:hypothetical protein
VGDLRLLVQVPPQRDHVGAAGRGQKAHSSEWL